MLFFCFYFSETYLSFDLRLFVKVCHSVKLFKTTENSIIVSKMFQILDDELFQLTLLHFISVSYPSLSRLHSIISTF